MGPGAERASIGGRIGTVFLTLRGRLILLVCFATVPAILFIFLLAAREREAALERMETDARHLGSLASREHAQQLNGARNLLRRLGGILACDREAVLTSACPEYLPALLTGLPQFANIGVADTAGDVVCSAADIREPARLNQSVAFTRALASDEVETGTYAMGFVGRPVLHLAYAARGANRAPCAVLFVAVELGWLDQLVQQTDLPADYSLLIIDRTGHVLVRSGAGPPELDAHDGTIPVLAGAINSPRGVVLEVGQPSVARYYVATPMEGIPGIFVVAGLPYARVQAAANRAFYRTLLGLLVVTVFAMTAAIMAAEFSVLRVLRSLTRAVRRFGAGDLSARAPLPGSHGELRELATSFSAMADALAARQREADEAHARLQALAYRVQIARDQEAGRIARELHDELGQVLTGLKMELSTVRRVGAGHASSTSDDEAILQMSAHIDSAIDTVRRISSDLYPPVLDRLGLLAAVDWLIRDCETKARLAVFFTARNVEEPIDRLVATTIFRIVQEAMTNVMRHAGATEVRVDLVGGEDTLALTIHDNGRGIDPSAAHGPEAFGIMGMRQRVHLLGGSWRLHGEPGHGTMIEVVVPRKPPVAIDVVPGLEPS